MVIVHASCLLHRKCFREVHLLTNLCAFVTEYHIIGCLDKIERIKIETWRTERVYPKNAGNSLLRIQNDLKISWEACPGPPRLRPLGTLDMDPCARYRPLSPPSRQHPEFRPVENEGQIHHAKKVYICSAFLSGTVKHGD